MSSTARRLFSGPDGKCHNCGGTLSREFRFCSGTVVNRHFIFTTEGHRWVERQVEGQVYIHYYCNGNEQRPVHASALHRWCPHCRCQFIERPLDAADLSPRDQFLARVSDIIRRSNVEHADQLIIELERRVPEDKKEEEEKKEEKRGWLSSLFFEEKVKGKL